MSIKRRAALPEVRAQRGVVVRDFAIFQVKLLIDGVKDVVLSALSIGALVLDLFAGGGSRPRVFYKVLAFSERFDLWLNLSGAVDRLERGELDEEGLFGASEAGSDSLLGKVEQMVKGRELPPEIKERLAREQERLKEIMEEERRKRGGRSGTPRSEGPSSGPRDPSS